MNLYTDGFDAPVDNAMQRTFGGIWPGDWVNTNPFGTKFIPDHSKQVILHSGVDLNLPDDKDAHSGVFAVANGLVRYAYMIAGSYGGVVVLQHALDASTVVYSRYEHLDTVRTRVGRTIMRGEQLGTIGNAHGIYQYHLHFDMTKTSLLANNPLDWVTEAEGQKLALNYLEPTDFLSKHRPMPPQRYQVTIDDLQLRQSPYGLVIGKLKKGQVVNIQGVTKLSWTAISFGRLMADNGVTIGYAAMQYLRAL